MESRESFSHPSLFLWGKAVPHFRIWSPQQNASGQWVEMQSREVGKLVVQPWKMRWLQRPMDEGLGRCFGGCLPLSYGTLSHCFGAIACGKPGSELGLCYRFFSGKTCRL